MGKSKKLKALQKKQADAAEAAMKGIPQSMVFRRGKVGQYVAELVEDMRQVMSPYTAKNLKESKKNSLKDFVSVASPMGVTHFMIFSQTVAGCNLRLVRLPHGPTFTFRVSAYSNIRDIVHMQKTPHSPGTEYQHPPLLVLNNFSASALAAAEELTRQMDEEERKKEEEEKQASPTSTLNPPTVDTLKLTSTMFQNMFPPIDVANLQVKDCRRVVIMQYEPRTNQILLRHYLVTAAPVGLHKGIKKLVKSQIPDLSKLDDISEFLNTNKAASGQTSDSEAEDAPDAKITLPQAFHGRGNRASAKSAIRLHELGPRASLQLMKVEEEMDGGKVLYHYRRSLTPQEEAERAKRMKQRKEEKARRKAEQERNVERKLKRKRGEGDEDAEAVETNPKNMVNAGQMEDVGEEDEGDNMEVDSGAASSSKPKKKSTQADDDAEWYRREVGEEPAEGMFDYTKEEKSERDFPLKAERRAEELARKREEAAKDSDDEDRPKKKQKLQGSGYRGMSRAGDPGNKGGGGQNVPNSKPQKEKTKKKPSAGGNGGFKAKQGGGKPGKGGR